MNHGYCKNCWWYFSIKVGGYKLEKGKIIPYIGNGYCYMHNGDKEPFKETKETDYCPDYGNRKKYNIINKQTLEEWINN